MTKPNTNEGSTRWWEFYAVRYAMGTAVGAIIFHLLCKSNTTLQPLLFETIGTAQSNGAISVSTTLDATRLTLLAVYGLVYCYIASAPILVFHAGRFLLKLDTQWATKVKWAGFCISVPLVAAIIGYMCRPAGAANQGAFFTSSLFIFALILWLQAVVVYRTLFHSDDLYEFYVKLSARRVTTNGEMVESYRHLREHGNSFFIVFLEIVLAMVLFGTEMVASGSPGLTNVKNGGWPFYVITLVVWISPAVFVWIVATVFERRFTDNEDEQGNSPDR